MYRKYLIGLFVYTGCLFVSDYDILGSITNAYEITEKLGGKKYADTKKRNSGKS